MSSPSPEPREDFWLRFRLWLAQLFAPDPRKPSEPPEQSVDVGSLEEAIVVAKVQAARERLFTGAPL